MLLSTQVYDIDGVEGVLWAWYASLAELGMAAALFLWMGQLKEIAGNRLGVYTGDYVLEFVLVLLPGFPGHC